MSSYISDCADAIAEALNSAGSGVFSDDFEAVRVYVPERDYKDISDLMVHVFARASDRTQETRGSIRKDIEIDVVYATKIESTTDPTDSEGNTELDAMMELGEELADFIATHGPYNSAPCLRVEQDPIFDFEYLRSHRVFVGLLKVFVMRS